MAQLAREQPVVNAALYQFVVQRQSPTGYNDQELALRLAGSARLKNLICRSHWGRSIYFTAEAKAGIKQDILRRLCDPILDYRIRRQLLLVMDSIVSYDWPSGWPQLVPELFQAMDAAIAAQPASEAEGMQQVTSLKTACQVLRILARWACGVVDGSVADPKLQDALSDGALPRVCRVLELVGRSGAVTTPVCECQHVALKALRSFFEERLPKALCDTTIFDSFYGSLVSVTTQAHQSLRGFIADPGTLSRLVSPSGLTVDPLFTPFFKVLKWAWGIHHKMVMQYQDPKESEKRARKVSKLFLEKYIPILYQGAVEILQLHESAVNSSGTKLFSKAFFNALDFLHSCILIKSLKPQVIASAEYLVGQVLVPRMAVTAEDIQSWNADPEEYLRKQNDPRIDFSSPKRLSLVVTCEFLTLLQNERHPLLQGFINLVGTRLQASQDPYELDSLIYFFTHLPSKFQQFCFTEQQVEQLLLNAIFPQLQSRYGFLKAKAVQCLARYCNIHWSSQATLHNVTLSVLALLTDKELAVRMQAAACFKAFVAHPNNHELLQPKVVDLVRAYIDVMNQADHGGTIRTLNKIVKRFGPALADYAVELCNVLVHKFARIQDAVKAQTEQFGAMGFGKGSKENDETDELDDALDAVDELINVLQSIVKAIPAEHQETFVRLQESLNGIFYRVLSHAREDPGCVEGISTLLTILIARSPRVHPASWNLIRAFHTVLTTGTLDYFGEILCALDNLISLEPTTFFSLPDQTTGETGVNVRLVVEMIEAVEAGAENEVMSDRVLSSAIKAVDVLTLAARGCGYKNTPAVAAIVPRLVTPSLRIWATRPNTSRSLKVLLANSVLSAIAAHAQASMTLLQSMNAIAHFTTEYVRLVGPGSDIELRMYDRNLFLVAMLELTTLVSSSSGSVFTTTGLTPEVYHKWLTLAMDFLQRSANEYRTRLSIKAERDAKLAANGGADEEDEWADETDDSTIEASDDGDDLLEGDEDLALDEDDLDEEDDMEDPEGLHSGLEKLAAKARAKAEADLEDEDDLLRDEGDDDMTTPIDKEDVASALYLAVQQLSSTCPQHWASLAPAVHGKEMIFSECSHAFSACGAVNLL